MDSLVIAERSLAAADTAAIGLMSYIAPGGLSGPGAIIKESMVSLCSQPEPGPYSAAHALCSSNAVTGNGLTAVYRDVLLI